MADGQRDPGCRDVPRVALEMVEALTIVLAAAMTRRWHSVRFAGRIVYRPLSRVPEHTRNLGVGVMPTTFGKVWGAEGAGVHRSGSDVMMLGMLACDAALAFGLAELLAHADWSASWVTPPVIAALVGISVLCASHRGP